MFWKSLFVVDNRINIEQEYCLLFEFNVYPCYVESRKCPFRRFPLLVFLRELVFLNFRLPGAMYTGHRQFSNVKSASSMFVSVIDHWEQKLVS